MIESDTNLVDDKTIKTYVGLYRLFKSKQICSNSKLSPYNNVRNRENKFLEILIVSNTLTTVKPRKIYIYIYATSIILYADSQIGLPQSLQVSALLGARLRNYRFPNGGKGFFYSPKLPNRFWVPFSLLFKRYRGIFPGGAEVGPQNIMVLDMRGAKPQLRVFKSCIKATFVYCNPGCVLEM